MLNMGVGGSAVAEPSPRPRAELIIPKKPRPPRTRPASRIGLPQFLRLGLRRDLGELGHVPGRHGFGRRRLSAEPSGVRRRPDSLCRKPPDTRRSCVSASGSRGRRSRAGSRAFVSPISVAN